MSVRVIIKDVKKRTKACEECKRYEERVGEKEISSLVGVGKQ